MSTAQPQQNNSPKTQTHEDRITALEERLTALEAIIGTSHGKTTRK